MARRTWTLIAVVIASGIVFLDSTIVNVALKTIAADLPSTYVGPLEGQTYIVSGYLLTLSALLILAGALADAYGRRRMLLVGIIGFGAASLACGLAPSMELLIAFRLVQGAFGALLVPVSLALINANFEGPARGEAFGIWAAATSALTVLGPVIGGFLVDSIGWQVAFLVNVPLVAIGAAIVILRVDESRNEEAPAGFDWLGAVAVALAVGGLAYGATRGQAQHWADLSAWIALGIGAIATVGLVPLMVLRPNPLVPPFLFRSRNFTVTNISTLLIYGALYSYSAFSSIFFQGTLGYSAAASGLSGIPIGLALVFLSTTFGRLAGRYGPRRFMAIGPAIMAVGLLWYVRLPAGSAAWNLRFNDPATILPPVDYFVDILPSVLLFAVGISMLVAPLITALMGSVPVGNSGLASAINNAISRIGPLLAAAVIFIGVSATFYAGLQNRAPQLDTSSAAVRENFSPLNPPEGNPTADEQAAARAASTDAFHLAMLIAALLCAGGAAANAIGIGDVAAPEPGPQPTGA